jgi:hypothetical protein
VFFRKLQVNLAEKRGVDLSGPTRHGDTASLNDAGYFLGVKNGDDEDEDSGGKGGTVDDTHDMSLHGKV